MTKHDYLASQSWVGMLRARQRGRSSIHDREPRNCAIRRGMPRDFSVDHLIADLSPLSRGSPNQLVNQSKSKRIEPRNLRNPRKCNQSMATRMMSGVAWLPVGTTIVTIWSMEICNAPGHGVYACTSEDICVTGHRGDAGRRRGRPFSASHCLLDTGPSVTVLVLLVTL
jgi:hypothetical protein